MYAAFILTILATPIFAWLGLHFGQAASATQNWAETLLLEPGDFVVATWGSMRAAMSSSPFGIDLSLPSAQICGLLAGCVPWLAFMFFAMAYAKSSREGEEAGSSRWAPVSRIRKYATRHNPDPDNVLLLSENAGLALSRVERDIELDRNLNVCVVGGSGSGKTRYYVKPNLMQLNADFVVTDPKDDTLPEVGHMLVEAGYEVRVFNTFVPERSMHYNPLHYVKTDLDVIEFVTMFFALTSNDQKKGGDQFWDDSAMLLMGAIVAFLRDYTAPGMSYDFRGVQKMLDRAQASEDNEGFKSPLDLAFEQIETGYREVVSFEGGNAVRSEAGGRAMLDPRKRRVAKRPTQLYNHTKGVSPYDNIRLDESGAPKRDQNGQLMRGFDPEEDFALRCYKKFKTAAGKTLKSIIISLNVKFNAISTSQVSQILSGEDEMRLDQLGCPGQKTALFCTFKDTNQQTLGFLHGLLVFQAINVISDNAINHYNGHMPRCVNFILDEFKSLRLPKNITDLISTIRSRNIAMSVILQSISQLDELYDDATGKSIVDCCDTMLFLGGKSEKTTEMISKSVGQQTITSTSTSVQHGGSGGYSKSTQRTGRALIDPSEVARLKRSQCIVLINGEDAIRDRKYPLDQHRRYDSVDPGHKALGPVRSPVFWAELRDENGDVKARKLDHRPPFGKPCKAARFQERFDVMAYLEERKAKEAADAEGTSGEPPSKASAADTAELPALGPRARDRRPKPSSSGGAEAAMRLAVEMGAKPACRPGGDGPGAASKARARRAAAAVPAPAQAEAVRPDPGFMALFEASPAPPPPPSGGGPTSEPDPGFMALFEASPAPPPPPSGGGPTSEPDPGFMALFDAGEPANAYDKSKENA